nr:transposase [Candidatus Vondammii sp. HM_W22]
MASLYQCHTEKLAFDKSYAAKHLGEAVDKVRRQEHKALVAEGYEGLKGR